MTQWKPQKNGLIYITLYITNRNAWNFHRIFVCYASIRVPSFITARCIIMKISTKMKLAIKHDTRCMLNAQTSSTWLIFHCLTLLLLSHKTTFLEWLHDVMSSAFYGTHWYYSGCSTQVINLLPDKTTCSGNLIKWTIHTTLHCTALDCYNTHSNWDLLNWAK